MYVNCDTRNHFLTLSGIKGEEFTISDRCGNKKDTPVLRKKVLDDGTLELLLEASLLELWTLESPVLYTLEADGEKIRFGFSSLGTMENKCILLNDAPIYLRGYIRGIIAHDHPNMTGGTEKEAALKNIRQAKKYGFNLVRFHSTIPSEAFVEAADELGLLIHMEIGFAYDFDEAGNKKNLAMSNTAWRETILKYRNNPSVCIFCIGNEMHNAGRFPEVKALYEEGKALAPGKLIMDNSGWGEFDRTTADVYSQHIAYFFPSGSHKNMFKEDDCWHLNGNVKDFPMKGEKDGESFSAAYRQEAVPLKPALSHEAVHYIELPDYERLAKKFDDFAAKVGPEYLERNGIVKPRFMTELPELIRKKGLLDSMKDMREASNIFKMMGIKCFLEELRLSSLCGYEMLQFADCFKYENKNGIVDCFDDDKFIPAEWMRKFNSDLVLLSDFPKKCYYGKEKISFPVYASDFSGKAGKRGKLLVTASDGELLCELPDVALAGGLQKLVQIDYQRKNEVGKTLSLEITASLVTEKETFSNSWKIWLYPERKELEKSFETNFASPVLREYFSGSKEKTFAGDLYITDKLDETLFEKLSSGVNSLLIYRRKTPGNTLEFPGAKERFKPCIWDRGSNLGGGFLDETLRETLGPEKYYAFNMQTLLEAGSKVCCDSFRDKIRKWDFGVDKPVRDRMSGLIRGMKDFIPEDTLRDFTHFFTVKCGNGEKSAVLCVCTYNMENVASPEVAALWNMLLTEKSIFADAPLWELNEFKTALVRMNEAGFREEDVMNRFWEQDNKRVEDTLFWEEAGVNLALLGKGRH